MLFGIVYLITQIIEQKGNGPMKNLPQETIKQLADAAIAARLKAYAPYSRYKVGAAVLGADGKIYTGCNIENASFGLTNCAERTAIFKMVSEGCLTFTALAVVGGSEGPGTSGPCGACRQVISEFCEDINETPIISVGQNGTWYMEPAIALYPRPFMKFEPNDD